MGITNKALNVATTAVAPEAEPAMAAATSAASAKSGSAGGGRGKTAPAGRTPAPVAATPASPPPASPGGGVPAALTDMQGAPSWYQKAASPDPVALGNTGGGFLLGLFLWAGGLAYLRGGAGGVKQLLRAKFFNQVSA